MNLSMLGFFKYGNFLLQNFQWLLARIGIIYQPPHLDILLPVGISFYTFHSLSYTLDIYRGVLRPTKSLRDFILAVSFFPQLVAGPIVRAGDFLPQLLHPPRLKNGPISLGTGVDDSGTVSENCSCRHPALRLRRSRVRLSPDRWLRSTRGPACSHLPGKSFSISPAILSVRSAPRLTLGFHLKDNFRFPYAAIGFSDFWRRWHISLSTFLRDYLYIPLGGNQVRPFRAALNLVIVMFLGGLWHGAAWTFVVWGLLHGSYLVIERIFRVSFEHKPWASTLPVRVLAGFATYAAVCIAWVFFRASDFTIASRMLGGMFGQHPHGDAILSTRELLQIGSVTAGLIAMHWAMRDNTFETAVMRLPPWTIAAMGSAMICAIIVTQGSSNAFIYFQF